MPRSAGERDGRDESGDGRDGGAPADREGHEEPTRDLTADGAGGGTERADGGAGGDAAVSESVEVGIEAGVDGPEGERTRFRAFLAVLPFLAVGLGDVVLLLFWGIDPLWGFAILPPILFCSVLAYLVFSTDFLEDRT